MSLAASPLANLSTYARSVVGTPAFSSAEPTAHGVRVDGVTMRAVLALPQVASDPGRLVDEVLIEGRGAIELGREAKMEVLRALGRTGRGAPAERFLDKLTGIDKPYILEGAYRAALAGKSEFSYWAAHAGVAAAMVGRFDGPPPALLSVSELSARHPHLRALASAGWNLEEVLARRPDIHEHLSAHERLVNEASELVSTYFDLPAHAVRSEAEEAALCGYPRLVVDKRYVALASDVLRGTGVEVTTRD